MVKEYGVQSLNDEQLIDEVLHQACMLQKVPIINDVDAAPAETAKSFTQNSSG